MSQQQRTNPESAFHRRQVERARLLREAQGILPISLRSRVLLVQAIVGVLFIAAGVVLLVSPYTTPLDQFWGWLYGIGFILCGFSFIWLVLIVKRRRRNKFRLKVRGNSTIV